MSDTIELVETTYDNCGQRAWAVRSGGSVLFYMVKRADEDYWQARQSLGRGYVVGGVPTLLSDWVQARTVGHARRRVFRDLAKRLRARASELGDTARTLERSTR